MQHSDASEKVVMAFPTPIYKTVWPDSEAVNKALLRTVLAREKKEPSTARSNVGGWQSGHDLLNWPGPEIAQLKEWINEAFGEIMKVEAGPQPFNCRFSAGAWANLNRQGPGEEVEDRPLSGVIEFIDPRPAINVYDMPGVPKVSSWTIRPEAGMMLMFPSWLRHSVLPYDGNMERLTIAFNLRIQEVSRQPPGPWA